jgi:asparagine synthase (glutamine-hydrolysing)
MSGVFGVVDARHPDDVTALVARMGAALRHRDWYVIETRADRQHGAGLGRVGIGVFNREPQPLRSADGAVMACFAGELYDTAPLWAGLADEEVAARDRNDGALVLRLYMRSGVAFIDRLAGSFVTAIWDARETRLLIANDRFGLYPLYFAHHDGRLVFAPEMKGILCDAAVRREVDAVALAEYLRFQHVLGEKTFFDGIRLLGNATCLTYDARADRVATAPYWDPGATPAAPPGLGAAEAAEEAGRLLDNAVRRSVAGPLRIGVQLSGGVDARALVGFARHHIEPTTITFGQPGCTDVVYAARLASIAGARHHYVPFHDGGWVRACADLHLELTEGEHSWIHAHGISTLAEQRVLFDVNLSGYGGGERTFTAPAELLDAVDDAAFCVHLFSLLTQTATWPGLLEVEMRLLCGAARAPAYEVAFESLRAELTRYAHLPPERRAFAFCLANLDRRLYGQFLVFGRSHVEQRLPFCDYAYADFVYALPRQMLVDRRLRRTMLRQRMPDLTRVPYSGDGLPPTDRVSRRLPARFLRHGRRALNAHLGRRGREYAALNADYEGWLRGDLRAWGAELLLGERARRRQWFNPALVESLWHRLQSGEPNLIGKLAPLMTWELLQRRFWDAP